MFVKISFILIFQFLFEIGPCHSQGLSQQPTPPPGIVMQNCTQFSTRNVNWFRFSSGNQNCFYISSEYSTWGWFAANDKCRTMNSSLFSIHDYNTNYLLSHRETTEYYSDTQTFWTGLNSLNKRGVYKWTDNSPLQYTNFTNVTSSGDFIPLNYMDQGRCVSFQSQAKTSSSSLYRKKYQGGWFKEDCTIAHRYICQKSPVMVPTPAPPPVGNCPSDWFLYANQKCVKYMNVSMTFNQSRDFCVNTNGGEMLSIHSEEEQNFITAYTAGLPSPYIGFIETDGYGRWVWDDSKRTDFTNWGTDHYLYTNKYCANIFTNDTWPGKWSPVNCSEKHAVICERPLDPSITTPGQSYATKKCKIPGFENFIQYRNSCYSVLDSDPNKFLSYYAAEGSCQKMNNAHLVSIVDPFEEAFLRYYIKQYGKSDKYWIGLQSKLSADTNVSQSFEWSDDWPVYYTNWDKYEPQFAGFPMEECVLFMKSNGTWRTTLCDSGLGYVCKTTTNPLPKMNSDKSGVCPTLKDVTDKSQQWVNIDKRSQYCYWFSVDRTGSIGIQSWVDSSFHCRQRNGTLVSIHSNHELLLLKNKFAKSGKFYNTWIGLSSDPNGDYVWEDGSALDYTNWDPNEQIVTNTDLNKEGSNRQCVEVKGTDAMWKQQPCSGSKRNYYICETKKIYHAHATSQNPGQTTSNPNKGSTPTSNPSKIPNNKSSKRTTKLLNPGQTSHNPTQRSTKSSSSTYHSHKRTTKPHNQKSTQPPIIKEQQPSKNAGMTGGAKAGIAFGVIGGVVVLLAIGYFAFKRSRPNSPIIPSFENKIYSSRRSNNPDNELGVRFSNQH